MSHARLKHCAAHGEFERAQLGWIPVRAERELDAMTDLSADAIAQPLHVRIRSKHRRRACGCQRWFVRDEQDHIAQRLRNTHGRASLARERWLRESAQPAPEHFGNEMILRCEIC